MCHGNRKEEEWLIRVAAHSSRGMLRLLHQETQRSHLHRLHTGKSLVAAVTAVPVAAGAFAIGTRRKTKQENK